MGRVPAKGLRVSLQGLRLVFQSYPAYGALPPLPCHLLHMANAPRIEDSTVHQFMLLFYPCSLKEIPHYLTC